MSESNIFEYLFTVERQALVLSAGVVVGAAFTGGLVVLVILCLLLLSSDNRGSRGQRIILQAYAVLLTLVVIGLQTTYFFYAHLIGLLHPHNTAQWSEEIFTTMRWPLCLLPVIVAALTDGLFVWRCYAVQRSLSSTRWQHITWVLPGCIWFLSLAAGILVTVMGNENMATGNFALINRLQAIVFISNAVINLYATVFISLRLLIHRRTMVASLGAGAFPARYWHIISILCQSAAINVPITGTAAVALELGSKWADFGNAMIPVAGASQAVASILIIHQVAKSRETDSKKEKTVELRGSQTYSESEREKPGPVS